MHRKRSYIDENRIFRSDHPGEDGVVFYRDKFMASIAEMEKKRLAKYESGPRPSWLLHSYLGRCANTIETWKEYRDWLKTHQ